MSLPDKAPEQKFEGWVILEQLGHKRLGGYVREIEIAGQGFLRIDVPDQGDDKWQATQFINPTTIYALTPTTEVMARAVALRNKPQPVERWELPRRLALPDREEDEEEDRICLCGHKQEDHEPTGSCGLNYVCSCQGFTADPF